MALIDDIMREAAAQKELESSGSVMAGKRYKPGRLGIVGDVIQQLLEQINPIEWMGGPGQAILGPIRTAGQRKIAKTLAMDFPELLREAVASKRMLHISAPQPAKSMAKEVAKAAPSGTEITPKLLAAMEKELINKFPEYKNYGLYQDALNPSFGGTMTLNPKTLRGLSPTGTRTATTFPQVAGHELTHFLTAPQTKALTEGQGMDVAAALQKYLGPHGRETVGEHLIGGESERAASEALSYLSEVLSPEARNIFMGVRPNLPTPESGARGTFGGISGMGVENKPLHQTLREMGVLGEQGGIWEDVLNSLKSFVGGQ